MKPYDLLIVGAGLFGAVVAQQARERGLRCLVVERRGAGDPACTCGCSFSL